jgi:hypothetical protein
MMLPHPCVFSLITVSALDPAFERSFVFVVSDASLPVGERNGLRKLPVPVDSYGDEFIRNYPNLTANESKSADDLASSPPFFGDSSFGRVFYLLRKR